MTFAAQIIEVLYSIDGDADPVAAIRPALDAWTAEVEELRDALDAKQKVIDGVRALCDASQVVSDAAGIPNVVKVSRLRAALGES